MIHHQNGYNITHWVWAMGAWLYLYNCTSKSNCTPMQTLPTAGQVSSFAEWCSASHGKPLAQPPLSNVYTCGSRQCCACCGSYQTHGGVFWFQQLWGINTSAIHVSDCMWMIVNIQRDNFARLLDKLLSSLRLDLQQYRVSSCGHVHVSMYMQCTCVYVLYALCIYNYTVP